MKGQVTLSAERAVIPRNLIARNKIVIAHSGHRDLLPGDEPRLRQAVETKLSEITAGEHQRYLLLTGIAEGADELVAGVAAAMGIEVLLLTLSVPGEEDRVRALQQQFGNDRIATCTLVAPSGNRAADAAYEQLAYILASRAAHLLVLWDGVDTAKPGGTSELVRIAMHTAKKKKGFRGALHQLIIPRQANRYPVCGNLLSQQHNLSPPGAYEWTTTDFPRQPPKDNIPAWNRYIAYNENFWRFFLPSLLVLLTIMLGYIGFNQLDPTADQPAPSTSGQVHQSATLSSNIPAPVQPNTPADTHSTPSTTRQSNLSAQPTIPADVPPTLSATQQSSASAQPSIPATDQPDPSAARSRKRLDAFFNAVNLITFNSSVLNTDHNVPFILNIARFTGLLFVLNAFIVAFMLAIGSNNKNLLRIYLWKLLGFRNVRLVTGLNHLSYPLALALKQRGAEVLLIDKDPDPNLRTEAVRRGIRVMSGSSQSASFLKRIQAHRVPDIYILEESDEENIKTLHELDQLWAKYHDETKQCHIYLKGARAAGFISSAGRLSSHVNVQRFNFYETISRKLLIRHPADRFSATCSSAEVVLFGFADMGRQLLLSLLQTVHTDEQHRLRITVFCKDAGGEQDRFFHEYPCLRHDADNPLYERPFAREIRNYVFPPGSLVFKELPESDADYFHDETIHRALAGSSTVSFYFCLEAPMQGAAYLNSLLARIGVTTADLRLFCHFNLPGRSELEHVAYVLNRQLPHTPVILFGQLEEECRALATADFRIDNLAALINYWYANHLPPAEWIKNPAKILQLSRKEWEGLSYAHQESSRRAADHLWVKLRYAGISPHQLHPLLSGAPPETGLPAAVEETLKNKMTLLSRMEQRRWCAEKLLDGFLPLQDLYPDAITSEAEWIQRWNDPDDKEFKRRYQSKKLHIDLLPFEKLFEGTIVQKGKSIAHSEKDKDRKQIEGIPYFLYVLFNSEGSDGKNRIYNGIGQMDK